MKGSRLGSGYFKLNEDPADVSLLINCHYVAPFSWKIAQIKPKEREM